IRIISDGVAKWPFSQMGFFWIPQQLWGPKEKTCGVWTICLHPNDTPETVLKSLEQLILSTKGSFIWSMDALLSSFASRRRDALDVLQQNILVLNRNLETNLSYQKIMSAGS